MNRPIFARSLALLDRRYWQKVESGEANVTLRTLVRLARALRVAVSQLFAK